MRARATVQLRIIELEQHIRQSETYHRALFERAFDPELLMDELGNFLQANSAATTMLCTEREKLLDTKLKTFVTQEEWPEFEVSLIGAFEGSDIPIFIPSASG